MIVEVIIFLLIIIYIKYLYLATCLYKESLFGNKYSRGFFLDDEGLSKMSEREFKIKTKSISFKDSLSIIRRGHIFYKEKEDSKLHKNNTEFTLILFHDSLFNYFNIMEYISFLLENFNCKIIFFPFLGFAGNHTPISNYTLLNDSKEILNYLLIENINSDYDKNNIFILGKGLGGGVILNIINNYENLIKGIILENPFSSLIDWIKYLYPYASYLISFVLKDDINNKLAIKIIESPLLFLCSKEDQIIPCSQSEDLYNLAINSKYKEIKIINFADHNDIYKIGMKSYIKKIQDFINISINSNNNAIGEDIIIRGGENSLFELEENLNLS